MTDSAFLADLARVLRDPSPLSTWRVQCGLRSNGSLWSRPLSTAFEKPDDAWAALFPADAEFGARPEVVVPIEQLPPEGEIEQGGSYAVAGVVAVGRAIVIDPGGMRLLPLGPARRFVWSAPRLGRC